MSEKPVATPRGSTTDNEIKDLKCQTGTTAHTEPKAQFGEVSNLSAYRIAIACALLDEFEKYEGPYKPAWPQGRCLTLVDAVLRVLEPHR